MKACWTRPCAVNETEAIGFSCGTTFTGENTHEIVHIKQSKKLHSDSQSKTKILWKYIERHFSCAQIRKAKQKRLDLRRA